MMFMALVFMSLVVSIRIPTFFKIRRGCLLWRSSLIIHPSILMFLSKLSKLLQKWEPWAFHLLNSLSLKTSMPLHLPGLANMKNLATDAN
ncbi:hypothetical protein HanRHA438_Chr01g0044961 [Helianthus annuus]|uniref:Uncharacterized protein n=1 Tax=Helianthus annuus TaxID=4232 RepID=A0A9K3P663_HELAN|nr:hypothetical protein HanXRQr2_Chr01g0044061 [Helianthus annuus]KAJ0613273.1 hypothetical protein HanHA300_Chr01g0036271 [Helianthus annuus]KAJ0628629.1 hypothetical protein HanHA89_Chr01g0038561 [Helianthus annuus]KAJ0784950.1 hypothetical protein HanLR1_Chr01g0037411 [Helianthus annuus]KAJ0794207.1 hypothetical protein HanOQP8_Chr01g0037481 [Helianthus annuus]